MANISAIKLPNGNTYNIVDKTSGYITVETDPIFSASPAAGISSNDITNWNGKQAALVSGTNIKTINGQSVLGTGNLTISAGQTAYVSKAESIFTTTAASTTTVPIGVSEYNSTTDILFVDINGLDLISGTDYTISGTNIILTTPITTTGTNVHFIVIRMVAASAADYSALKGDTGDAAGFGTISATVDANVGTPSVTVSSSGSDTAKNFSFAFENLKGETGSIASMTVGTVTTGAAGSSASVTITGTAENPVLNFTIPKGDTGATGNVVWG